MHPSLPGPWPAAGRCSPCSRGSCMLETLLTLTGPLLLPQTPHPVPSPDPRRFGGSCIAPGLLWVTRTFLWMAVS